MGIKKTSMAQPPGQHGRIRRVQCLPYVLGGLLFIILPFFLPPFYQVVISKAFTLAIFAMSLDLLVGYTGLFSLGHAVFFGAGSYTVAMLMLHAGITSFWIGAPLGLIVATLLAVLSGLLVVRFSGLYFLLLTFALGELFFGFTWRVKWLQTPGVEACIGIPKPNLGIPGFTWTATSFYFFCLFLLVLSFFLLKRIVSSQFGNALTGIRENETRMRALGYNTLLYKYVAYILAGLFAGLGGVLFAYVMGFTVPELFGIQYSFMGQLMIILGGAGTIFGPVLGALIIVFLELLISLIAPVRWPLILGVFFVTIIMFYRGGLAPHLLRMWEKRFNHYGNIKG